MLNHTFIGKQLKPLHVNEPAPIIHSTASEELSNITFSTKATLKELRNLDIIKASGPDDIPPTVLKTAAPELAVPFTRLFRKSLDIGIVPSAWKHANVTPSCSQIGHTKRSEKLQTDCTPSCSLQDHGMSP